jgi:hypothetical protein
MLGSGLMGGKPGTLFARSGHEEVFSCARHREKFNRLARKAGCLVIEKGQNGPHRIDKPKPDPHVHFLTSSLPLTTF